MKLFFKKNYLIILILAFLSINIEAYGKNTNTLYSKEAISNYFIGIVSANQDHAEEAFEYFSNVEFLQNKHKNFKIEYLRTLVLLEKFDEAFSFSKKVWAEDEPFFEAELILGLNFFIKEDYDKAEKYFERLNNISRYNLIFIEQSKWIYKYDDLFGNVLLSWVKAAKNDQAGSFSYLNNIPDRYENLKKIQNSLMQCYFSSSKTFNSFDELINSQDYSFSRYNFFLANYLLFENKKKEAEKVILRGREKHHSNILLKQSEKFLLEGKTKKIKSFFNCKNPKDDLAEYFYILANLLANEKDYQGSNFYLKLSFFLNNKFIPNKTLLAENYFYQKKYKLSEKTYKSIKKIGKIYSWYASKNIFTIQSLTSDGKDSINNLEKEFKLIVNPNAENYYDLANFYKDNEYFEESIKYYSLAMQNIEKDHFLIPKILDRRGTSYERIGNWEKAEKDLKESLRILPDQPYVLNYLAYSWIEKKINVDEAMNMLKKATKLRENDGYITDSLGWAYFAKKNYVDAEKFLRIAVQLMPRDPIINDHYADALWMLNKNIQARYFWKYVLSLDKTEESHKETINDKLIFGINNKL